MLFRSSLTFSGYAPNQFTTGDFGTVKGLELTARAYWDALDIRAGRDHADPLIGRVPARERGQGKPILPPVEAMAAAASRVKAKQKVGVLYGPERTGLDNDEIAKIIHINDDGNMPHLRSAVVSGDTVKSANLQRFAEGVDLLRQIGAKPGFLHQIEPLPYAFAETGRHLLPQESGAFDPRAYERFVAVAKNFQ